MPTSHRPPASDVERTRVLAAPRSKSDAAVPPPPTQRPNGNILHATGLDLLGVLHNV